MRKIVFLFITVILTSVSIYANSLKLEIGGSYNFLISQEETENENTPFETTNEKPSLEYFYDNHSSLSLDISYHAKVVLFGFECGYLKKKSKNEDFGYLLGSSLSQIKYTPYFGIGKYLMPNSFFYGIVGISLNSFSGESKLPITIDSNNVTADATYNYSSAAAFRFGFGCDFEKINKSPLFIGLKGNLEFGSLKRGNIDLTYDDQDLGYLEPTGDTKVYDNSFSITLTVGYQFDFTKKK